MRKFLWGDCETTGLDPVINAPHQIAGIIVVEGVEMETFDLKFRPHPDAVIEDKALEKSNITKEELMARPMSSAEAQRKFDKIMTKYVDKYNKSDKMVLGAYNAYFDAQFMNEWYRKHNNNYFFGLVHGGAYFDPLQMALMYEIKMGRRIFQPDRKLATVYKTLFGEELVGAHDALIDIKATRKSAYELWGRMTSGE